MSNFSAKSWKEEDIFWSDDDDDDVHFVPNQQALFIVQATSTLKQQTEIRNVTLLSWFFTLSPKCYVLYSGETANTNYTVSGWPEHGLNPWHTTL